MNDVDERIGKDWRDGEVRPYHVLATLVTFAREDDSGTERNPEARLRRARQRVAMAYATDVADVIESYEAACPDGETFADITPELAPEESE